MFSRMEMEEYLEYCSILRLNPVDENIVLGSQSIYFTYVRAKFDLLLLVEFYNLSIIFQS